MALSTVVAVEVHGHENSLPHESLVKMTFEATRASGSTSKTRKDQDHIPWTLLGRKFHGGTRDASELPAAART